MLAENYFVIMAICSFHLAIGQVSVNKHNEPEIPDSCKQSTLCEEVANYPQQEIDKLITEVNKLQPLQHLVGFQHETKNNTVRTKYLIPESTCFEFDKLDLPETPDIEQRFGPTEENIDLCKSTEMIVYPLSARASDGKWYTLLNRKENPVQGFKVEICEQPDSPCSDITVTIPGYVSRCLQKYLFRTATAVVRDANDTLKTVTKQIKVPSCCVCVAKAANVT